MWRCATGTDSKIERQMTLSERIDFLIKNLEGDNATRFSEKTGIPKPHLSMIRRGKLRLSNMKLNFILDAYPMVNREWLETGEGYPGDLSVSLAREHYADIIAKKDCTIEVLTRELEIQQKVIEKLLR